MRNDRSGRPEPTPKDRVEGILKTPPGYILCCNGARVCYLKEEHAESLRALGFESGEATEKPIASTQGRREHPIFALPNTSISVLWKRCRRGGLMEPLLGLATGSVEPQ